jgi:dihydrofolate reductase
MRKLTITTFLTLDGVMQGPGGPTEDPSGGFDKGGWLVPFFDEDAGRFMDSVFAEAGGFVLGRKTYDIFAAVAQLKQQPGGELQVHGSGEPAQTLMRHGLIDVYRLLVFPVVLGEGMRLFRTPLPRSLRLVEETTTSTGVKISTYEPAGEVTFGSF